VPHIELVTSQKELKGLCAELLKQEVVAIDTEFFWESTYYPILGLVQIADADGRCHLIDAVMLKNLHILRPLLESETTVKILHDAPQDLGILARTAAAKPCNIFDTRLSAGFCGFSATTSLQNLLAQVLKVEIAKTETRSNWIRRPLSTGQLEYAAEDVVYLADLHMALINRCGDRQILAWIQEENSLLDKAATYLERDPREMYLRVKGARHLTCRELAVLRETAAWRENTARRRNLPRRRVMSDSALIELAHSQPRSGDDISKTGLLPRNLPTLYARQIAQAIYTGSVCPEAECPSAENPAARFKDLKARTNALLRRIREKAEKRGIDPALVASRADAEAYILYRNFNRGGTPGLASGWRRELLADDDS
jgi:ribonuclease D